MFATIILWKRERGILIIFYTLRSMAFLFKYTAKLDQQKID